MPRPPRCRRICQAPQYESFSPEECPRESEAVTLTLDEYEVIRLVDLEKKTHEQCAAQMDISRTTVTEIYETARGKIARCIVLGQRLVIAGGNYRLCEGREHTRCGKCCCRKGSKQTPLTSLDLSQELPAADRFNSSLPKSNLQNEGDIIMKIAVTYENGEIFQHFGHKMKTGKRLSIIGLMMSRMKQSLLLKPLKSLVAKRATNTVILLFSTGPMPSPGPLKKPCSSPTFPIPW